ncbi:Ankyrin repeat-containing [Fusarium albosuccineum]|uniref:Ankyrin repeat-containing n=1 Tax=Fusarium albosuccineum TaxID=1237068 RepID=A0A8H4LC53_9HYPO|nr:Ankyrin repeat-containing [Fusarium albosuccineum]
MSVVVPSPTPLCPDVRLAKVVSEFGAGLDEKHRPIFKTWQTHSPPSESDVIRLTEEVNRDGSRLHQGSWRAFGTRLFKLLDQIQILIKPGDILVSGSQNMVASGVWAAVRMSLEIATGYLSYFERVSLLLMRLGHTTVIQRERISLFPNDHELKGFMCEYLIVIVELCKTIIRFEGKRFLAQLTSGLTLEKDFKEFETQLGFWSKVINKKLVYLNEKAQANSSAAICSTISFWSESRRREAEDWRIQVLRQLSPHQDEFESTWRRQRRKGTVEWILDDQRYADWRSASASSTLLIYGSIGSGKTVTMANITGKVWSTLSSQQEQSTPYGVASFFCQFRNQKTLLPRVIFGSIAHQFLRSLGLSVNHSAFAIIVQILQLTTLTLSLITSKIGAQGMYLWVVLQIDALFPLYSESVTTLGDICHLLTRLPTGLFNSFEQALGKITDQKYGSRIFQLVAAAMCPLMKNELRVALNIQPGVPVWDSCTLARDPEAMIYRCGGGLLEIDEEDDTVHFIHHSALQHLLTDVQTDYPDNDAMDDDKSLPNASPFGFPRTPNHDPVKCQEKHRHEPYLFSANQANVTIGYICITALSLEHHDRRISRPKKMAYPLARFMRGVLQRKGKYQNTSEFDITRIIEDLSRAKPSANSNGAQLVFGYPGAHWLAHTSQPCSDPEDEVIFHRLFVKLIRENAPGLRFPWGEDTGDSHTITWAKDHRHLRLLYDLLPHAIGLDFRGIVQSFSTVPDSQLSGLACHGETLKDALCRFVDFHFLDEIGVDTLLKLGASPNKGYNTGSLKGITPLQLVIKRISNPPTCKIDVVRRLLEAGADTRGSECASPPILLAINRNWAEGYQLLFSHGARVVAVREEFNKLLALNLAVFCEPDAGKMIEDLVASGAMMENYFKEAWLPVATRLIDVRAARSWKLPTFSGEETDWVDVNRVDVDRPWLFLHDFVSSEESSQADRRVLEPLVKTKSDPHLISMNGMTPLGLAVQLSATHLARELLQAGADPHKRYYAGKHAFSDPQLPLLTAARKGCIEMVRLLLANGASVLDNVSGKTILAMALQEETELGETSEWIPSRFDAIAQFLNGYPLKMDEILVSPASLLITITRAVSKREDDDGQEEYQPCMMNKIQDSGKLLTMGVKHFIRTGMVNYDRNEDMETAVPSSYTRG